MNNILDWKEYSRSARNAAAEGCVLLRNEKQALPIRPGEMVSVFGRIQLDYYKSGTGSGGMVMSLTSIRSWTGCRSIRKFRSMSRC